MEAGPFHRPASFGRRAVAALIDYGVFFALFYAYLELVGTPNDEGGLSVNGLPALPIPLGWLALFPVMEFATGMTMGKAVLGMRVESADGERLSVRQSLKRRAADLIDLGFYGIPAFISYRNSERKQRLGDLWAKTVVLQGRPEQAAAA